jgi:hypothetical protein
MSWRVLMRGSKEWKRKKGERVAFLPLLAVVGSLQARSLVVNASHESIESEQRKRKIGRSQVEGSRTAVRNSVRWFSASMSRSSFRLSNHVCGAEAESSDPTRVEELRNDFR